MHIHKDRNQHSCTTSLLQSKSRRKHCIIRVPETIKAQSLQNIHKMRKHNHKRIYTQNERKIKIECIQNETTLSN